jgi:hypothetical protein
MVILPQNTRITKPNRVYMNEPEIVINLGNLEELNIQKAKGIRKELLCIIRNRAYRQLYSLLNNIATSKKEKDNKERFRLIFKILKRIKAIEPDNHLNLASYIVSRNGM